MGRLIIFIGSADFELRNFVEMVRLCSGTCLLIMVSALSFGQNSNDNCSNALNLCTDITYVGSNTGATTEVCPGCADGATVAGNFCFELDNTVWFSFTTNSTGGNAVVDITNISCLAGPGNDDELQGVIIEAGVPCDESTYTAVSNCEAGSATDFSLTAAGLLPSTTYYILLDGDISGSTNAAQCDFSIAVSGPAVDINSTVNITPETCGANDGVIDVTTLTGGLGPYQYSLDGGTPQGATSFNGLGAGSYTLEVTDANGCLYDLGTQVVGVTGGPAGGIAVITDADCNQSNGEIQISSVGGGNPPYQYSLNGGAPQASNTFTGLNAGTYIVTVSDALGCEQTIAAIIVSNTSGPTNATAATIQPTCGSTDGEITVTVTGGALPLAYSLNGGTPQASNQFTGLGAGTYSIEVTDQNGCVFVLNNVVLSEDAPSSVPEITISATPNPACTGDLVTVTATATTGGANPNYEFFVNGGSVQNGSSDTYAAVFTAGDLISCTLTSDDSCVVVSSAVSNTVTIIITNLETPTSSISTPSDSVCEGESAIVTAQSTGCSNGETYDWYVNGALVQSSTDSTLTLSSLVDGDIVNCQVSCNGTCTDTTTSSDITFTVITVTADAGQDQLIIQGGSTTLDGSASGSTYSWDPVTGLTNATTLNPVASPSTTTTYTLTVTEGNCTAIDDVTIYVTLPIVVPNTFTPNGDGTNDLWEIFRIGSYPNCTVHVYDRWGQRVYKTTGYTNDNGWDGTNRGRFLPAATYYYVIDLNTGDDDLDIHTGSITIVY